jgi:hypothetical protein
VTANSARRVVGSLVGLVVVVPLLVVPPVKLWDRLKWRADFGTWEATTRPPRVDFCGHHLYPDGQGHSLAYLRAHLAVEEKDIPGARWSGLHKVGQTPAGTPVMADIPNGNCATGVVFVSTAPGTYQAYTGDTGG